MYKPYGIIPPIITPFDEEGKVNYDSLAKMSVYLVENGVHGLFPFGTTGEFYAVSDEEYVKALETVRDAVKGMTNCYGKPIQLMAGCSHITTRGVIRLIHLVEQVGGYDAVSVLTPMFVSQTQDELYQYYKTIAESTKMPVLMYNNKPKTNVTIAPATVARLAKDCPNIIGVKDSTGDMTNCEEYLRLTADQRDHFNVMMGRDTMIHAALAEIHLGLVFKNKVVHKNASFLNVISSFAVPKRRRHHGSSLRRWFQSQGQSRDPDRNTHETPCRSRPAAWLRAAPA